MTRRRLAITITLGVLLGFFAGVAAMSLSHDSRATLPTADAGAASQTAAAQASTQYGQMQAGLHGAGLTKPQIVPFIHTLRVGQKGCECPSVFQLQRALKRAGVRSGKATGFYGAATGRQVSAFQRKAKIAPSGVYGLPTHLKLSKFYDAAGRGRLAQVAHSRKVVGWRQGILRGRAAYARAAIAGRAHYSQGPSRAFLPSLPATPLATDCSGYATWLYKISGAPTSGLAGDLPDPSGFGYRIVGYTGTLAQHGVRIAANAALHVGDLVFYGGGYPYGHVAVVVDAVRRLVTSHGQPGVRTVPFNYRHVSTIRRYF